MSARPLRSMSSGGEHVARRTPRRSRDAKDAAAFLGLEAEAVEYLFNVGGGQIAAEALPQEVELHLDDGAVKRARIYVGVCAVTCNSVFLEGRGATAAASSMPCGSMPFHSATKRRCAARAVARCGVCRAG